MSMEHFRLHIMGASSKIVLIILASGSLPGFLEMVET